MSERNQLTCDWTRLYRADLVRSEFHRRCYYRRYQRALSAHRVPRCHTPDQAYHLFAKEKSPLTNLF